MAEMWIMGARIAFANGVFEKSGIAGDPKSKERYGSTFILPPGHPDLAKLQATEKTLVLEHKWKDKTPGKEVYDLLKKKDRLAVHDGDDKKKFEGFEGNFYIAAGSDTRPTAVDRDRSPLTKDDGKIYSGCVVNAKVEMWVQDNQWGQRVNTTLLGVQFVKDGDAFGSGSAPASPDDFPDLDAGGGEADSLFD
jgi:hypothetical protein